MGFNSGFKGLTVNNADTNELYWVQFSGSWIPSLTLSLIV